jgi:iron complex outermembrane receptor protein
MTRSYSKWLLSGTCIASLAASPAFANQNAPTDPTTRAASKDTRTPNTLGDEEIIVTAQKRPQVLLDVPQSITVVSGKTLEAQHANTFRDYLKLVPGLQLDQGRPGESRLILRGINTGGVASSVGVYVDETPFGSSSGLVNGGVLAGDFDTFDLDRIEVLRGPQGTLYGASSLSGVLRFVTAAPQMDRLIVRGRAGVEAEKGGDLGYLGNLAVNVPLAPTLAFRASGSFRKDGGFIDSIGTAGSDRAKNINSDRVYSGRASLLFKPSDAASVRLTAIGQNIDANASTEIEANSVTLEPLHGFSQSQFVPNFSKLHYRQYNATGIFKLGFGDLTTSTSYGEQKQSAHRDLTFAFSGFLPKLIGPSEVFIPQKTNLTKFTQEVRLSGQTPFADWLIGGFYTHEKGLIDQDITPVVPGTLTTIDVSKTPLGPTLGHLSLSSKYRETAGFADATVHLAPRFDFQFGGRYSKNKQSANQTTTGSLLGVTAKSNSSSEHVFTYSVAPKFRLNPNTTLYARVAKGFRPGGPNVIAPNAPPEVPRTYKSDSVTSYEVGVKAQSPDRRFSLDVAAFLIKWKDIQLFTSVLVDKVNYGVNINGSRAKSEGVELTATARPVPGLDLSLNGAYTHARLTGSTPASVGGRVGDALPFTPRLSAAFNADYSWQLSSEAKAHIGGSLRHLSSQTANYSASFVAANGRQRHVRPYNVVDVNTGVDFGHFNVEAYVRNLGNSHGITSISGPGLLPAGAVGTGIIRPRTVGMTVGFNY